MMRSMAICGPATGRSSCLFSSVFAAAPLVGETDDGPLDHDRDCPFCRPYCETLSPKDSSIALKLIDARKPSSLLQELTDKGLSVDQGMYVKVGGQAYFGSAAVQKLTEHSSERGLFGMVNKVVFGHRRIANVIYPASAAIRKFSTATDKEESQRGSHGSSVLNQSSGCS